ncbi:MAG: dipeptidase PepE [Kangiellaceae bacterium]
MNLLLLSSSKVKDTGYLTHALPLIKEFLPKKSEKPIEVLFIPYAGVTINYDDYESRVAQALTPLNIRLTSIHHCFTNENGKNEAKRQIKNTDCILVGGGNTFALLNKLYELDILQTMQKSVSTGTAYVGWSAGSNIAGETIKTTNDMPIVEPPSFSALNLIPYQLNPHYLEANPVGHHGETRQQRIEEYLAFNPKGRVLAIPEGTALLVKNQSIMYLEGVQTKALGYLFTTTEKKQLINQTNIQSLI